MLTYLKIKLTSNKKAHLNVGQSIMASTVTAVTNTSLLICLQVL